MRRFAFLTRCRQRLTLNAMYIGIFLGVFFVFNAWWIWNYRSNQPLNIDEAGYLCLAVIDYYGLHYGWLNGWLHAISMPSLQAPLVPALTSLLFGVIGPNINFAFVIPLAGAIGCIVAAYDLGIVCRSRWVGWAAAILVASCPVIIWYSRTYEFATWAAFTATMALIAIIRSKNFKNFYWSLVFGASLGLMPLARTMTIAFVPGMVAAAFWVTITEPSGGRPRFLNLLAGLLFAVLISAWWFIPNGRGVFAYLLGFGYGAHAGEYGRYVPILNFRGLLHWTKFTINAELLLPHAIILVFGFCASIATLVRMITHSRFADIIRNISYSPLIPLLIFCTEATLALTSTKNIGSGFIVPIVPALMVLASTAIFDISSNRNVRFFCSIVIFMIALIAVLPNITLHSSLARARTVNLPLLAGVTISNGLAPIEAYEQHAGYGQDGSTEPVSVRSGHAWLKLDDRTAINLRNDLGSDSSIAFAFRDVLYNVNTVNLAALLQSGRAFDVQQIDPVKTGTSVNGYFKWLQRNRNFCGLLTSSGTEGQFLPAINPIFMKKAAEQAGFLPIAQWNTPDRQEITLWKHRAVLPNCP